MPITDKQRANQSLGERRISAALESAGLDYEVEYVFPDLVASSGRHLRFDFAVFDDNGDVWFLVEYQGEQHYQAVGKFNGGKGLGKQKFNDRKKVEYCINNGYDLVVIPYTDFPLIDYDYILNKVSF